MLAVRSVGWCCHNHNNDTDNDTDNNSNNNSNNDNNNKHCLFFVPDKDINNKITNT